jgi:hypothetical protein
VLASDRAILPYQLRRCVLSKSVPAYYNSCSKLAANSSFIPKKILLPRDGHGPCCFLTGISTRIIPPGQSRMVTELDGPSRPTNLGYLLPVRSGTRPRPRTRTTPARHRGGPGRSRATPTRRLHIPCHPQAEGKHRLFRLSTASIPIATFKSTSRGRGERRNPSSTKQRPEQFTPIPF